MLTPQEVADKTFKQAFVGGYDMPAVDEFLEMLTEDYSNLYKENAVLKNKMKVLVEKLEEYRGNEDSIRQAYMAISAQARTELDNARAEGEKIMGEARLQAEEYTGNIEKLVAREEKRLSVMREQTASFVNILKECYGRQMEQLEIILTASMEDSPKKKHDDAVRATAEAIKISLAMDDEDDEPPMEPTVRVSAEPEAPAESAAEPVREPQAAQTQPQEPQAARSEPEAAPAEPEQASAPQEKKPETDEDLIYSIQQSMTATFSEEVDWTPEEISEVRRPSFNFTSLPDNFGHKHRQKGKRGRE